MKWVKPKPLESSFQTKVLNRARVRGWWGIKVETRSMRGVDDLVLVRRGRTIWIECKREGEEARRQQEVRIKEMRDHGAEVFVVDSMDDAEEILQ